jgi:DNA (cytosine-5)-methyltransferase 1
MIRDQFVLDVHQEIIIDNFAGGGGASTGIEMALGRCVDIAINHDPEAVAMHEMNHPQTQHFCESVWDVDPLEATQGRPVGLAWFSPDCKHFSKAKGGKPVSKHIRGLAWIIIRWVMDVRPRVFILENVEEFRTWGPLAEDMLPCKKRRGETFNAFVAMLTTGVDPDSPALVECVDVLGLNEAQRQRLIVGLGCDFEHKELRACDYNVPTIRKRLFGVGRCDGLPIVWPEATHGAPNSAAVLAGLQKPWRSAAECIDWSILCPSIFERSRPLAEATLKRIARGIRRYVIDAAKPFVVKVNHGGDAFRGQEVATPMATITAKHGTGIVTPYLVGAGGPAYAGKPKAMDSPFNTLTTENHTHVVAPFLTEHANGSTQRNFSAEDPLRTQCAEVKGGHFAMVAPTLVQTGYGEAPGQAPRAPGLDKPLGTVVAGGTKHALISAFLAKHYGGGYEGPGVALDTPTHTATTVDHHALVTGQLVGCGGRAAQSRPRDASEPAQTLTAKADTCLVTSNLAKLRGTSRDGQPTDAPLHTISAGGTHHAEVRAFLVKYYSEGGTDQAVEDPMHTIPTHDRLGLVTVAGQQYFIADIGMRMLEPHELYAAQGFPANYVIAPTINGRRLPKHAQVRMCGNSVCPPLAAALVRANVPEMAAWTPKEAKQRRVAA